MHDSHDPNRTVDHSSAPADSLDAGLAAGLGPPRSSLPDMRPVLLKEAEGDSAHVVKPHSDAMPSPEQVGDRYQLQGEIARGGMGAVLRGRDVDLGRDLAIKVLLEKHAHRPEVARRFIEEAQIGGQLQHPGVVPVYDIGRFGERPFFTMKLVKGSTLQALLAERGDERSACPPGAEQQPTSEPLVATDLPRFLDIALKVAQTLAYAHAKGVIHRDLKPANVMVGAFGEVQVMDWGLAKVLAEGGIADEEKASRGRQSLQDMTEIRTARSGTRGSGSDTESGTLLGTPAYMPPEQANGEVARMDRRADVFGLGAILCQILTGKPPYVGRSPEEVRRKAANGDLAEARAWLDGCGADAELIALTTACLSAEPIDRPRDARAVADALTAYLDGVQARLHRAELAEAEARARAIEEAKRRRLTLALAGTVLLAATLGGGGWLWVKTGRDARQAQLTRDVNDALNKATVLREKAKAATSDSAALFAQAREQAQRALALIENGLADRALQDQVMQLQTELDQEDKDRKLIAALDAARLDGAATLAGENRFATERAVPLFREAFRAYGLPSGEGDPAAVAARLREHSGKVQEAVSAALDEWIDLANNPTRKISEPHLDWLRALAASVELDGGWRRQFRTAMAQQQVQRRQADLEKLAREVDVAKVPAPPLCRLFGQLWAVQAKASALALLRRTHQQYPADFWVNEYLGQALRRSQAPDLAESVRYHTAAVTLRPDSSGAHVNLGNALLDNGRLDDAIACFRKAAELDPKYANAHSNLGNALKAKGQLDEAIACCRKAIKLDPKFAWAHSNLGTALLDKGQIDESITHYRTASELDPKFAYAHNNLGNALKAKGRLNDAIACYRKAIEVEPFFAKAHYNLGTALSDKGQIDESIRRYRTAIEHDPKFAYAHHNLGNALKAKGQLDEAIACYKKAIEVDPKYGQGHYSLGGAMLGKRDYDAAIACFRQAIKLDPKHAQARSYLGIAYYGKGDLDQAIACCRTAIELDPKLARAHAGLGSVLFDKGRYAGARDALVRAIELFPKNHPVRLSASRHLRRCQGLLKIEARLPRILRGEDKPDSAQQHLEIAMICQSRQMHATAARFAADAFSADATVIRDMSAGHRYMAARAASLAAAGQGVDVAGLDEKGRSRLRKQTLDWLRDDFAVWEELLRSGPPAGCALVQEKMRLWSQDGAFAGVRDIGALARLPAEECAPFIKLWADVAALLKKAETPAKNVGKP
jgi:serine/threonine-protein kinase